ncbi:MAG: hypothetical protein EBS05_17615 [Proteobacteria bacterium]|nr:hypothetical protein [Pseudomonadota bacterium]
MLALRLILFLVLLASAGVIVLSELKLKPLLEEVREKEKKIEADLSKEKESAKKVAAELAETKTKRDEIQNDLDQSKKAEDEAKKLADAETKKAQAAAAEVAKAKAETEVVRKEGAEYFVLKDKGLTPTLILAEHEALPKAKEELVTLKQEQRVINVQLTKTSGELNAILNPKGAVALPSLVGKVSAVDPKWDFVILDIGANHGLLRNGELSISREGRLIARVKAARVETDYAIANVMPGFKKSEIREGDSVLTPSSTYLPAQK